MADWEESWDINWIRAATREVSTGSGSDRVNNHENRDSCNKLRPGRYRSRYRLHNANESMNHFFHNSQHIPAQNLVDVAFRIATLQKFFS